MTIAMVMPRVTRDRATRHKALVHWDEKLHETLSDLRDALDKIKELDRDAEPRPTKEPR